MPQRSLLGVIIITKNEAKKIARCLSSVQWADDIIVVDCGSTDATVDIAKQHGAKVFHQDWLGFGSQKNFALSCCRSEWVLSLDADEVVDEILKNHILQAIQLGNADTYRFKRLSQFCGQWIYHGDWGRDQVTRLFKNGKAVFSNDIVHERLIYDGSVQLINGVLKHYSQDNIAMLLQKINDYSSASAQVLFQKGKTSNLFKANIHQYWTFFRGFMLRAGFLDGTKGYLVAKLSAYGAYCKYVKLREKQQNAR